MRLKASIVGRWGRWGASSAPSAPSLWATPTRAPWSMMPPLPRSWQQPSAQSMPVGGQTEATRGALLSLSCLFSQQRSLLPFFPSTCRPPGVAECQQHRPRDPHCLCSPPPNHASTGFMPGGSVLCRRHSRAPPLVPCQMSGYNADPALSHNVMGQITGSEKPNEVITIGGHIDSWDIGMVRGGW